MYEFRRETTEELLDGLKSSADNFDPKEHDEGETAENIYRVYGAFKEVSETLTYHELVLLYSLRCCPLGETFRFRRAAENLLNAYNTRDTLREPKTPNNSVAGVL